MKKKESQVSEGVEIFKQTAKWDYSQEIPILRVTASVRVRGTKTRCAPAACFMKLRFVQLSPYSRGKEKQYIQQALDAVSAKLGLPHA